MTDYIKIKGARANNLKNIDIEIPRNKLVVMTGVSGSGKSSLVNEILFKRLGADLMRMKTRPARAAREIILSPRNPRNISGKTVMMSMRIGSVV